MFDFDFGEKSTDHISLYKLEGLKRGVYLTGDCGRQLGDVVVSEVQLLQICQMHDVFGQRLDLKKNTQFYIPE